jgi:hypothetical protein
MVKLDEKIGDKKMSFEKKIAKISIFEKKIAIWRYFASKKNIVTHVVGNLVIVWLQFVIMIIRWKFS